MDSQPSSTTNQTANQAPEKKSADGFGIASLVLGIVAVLCCCACLGLPCGILAIIFSLISRSRRGGWNALAVAGLILGIVAVVLTVIIVFVLPLFQDGGSFGATLDRFYDEFEKAYYQETGETLPENWRDDPLEYFFRLGSTASDD